MNEETKTKRFESVALPHLHAAYNLARWLTRDAHDAEDVVQEAYLRAFRFFDGFHGDSARAWLMGIVRNTCYTWLSANRNSGNCGNSAQNTEFDEGVHGAGGGEGDAGSDPEALLLRKEDGRRVNEALASLPVAYREILVLRELSELSYKEIAEIAEVPVGTVMSRLARGRKLLAERVVQQREGAKDGL